MKTATIILSIATVVNLAFTTLEEKTKVFNLNDKENVKSKLSTFVMALKKSDFETEKKFRTPVVQYYSKTFDAMPTIVNRETSLNTIGYMSSLKFTEIHIDKENSLIMRIISKQEENGIKVKHRYIFRINEEGLINGVLYLPPLSSEEMTASLTEEQKKEFLTKIGALKEVELETDEDLYEMEYSMKCAEVYPIYEEIVKPDTLVETELEIIED